MRILIIRAGALGDTLMLMPAIALLKDKAEVIVAGRIPGIDYIRPHVERCIDLEQSGWHLLFVEDQFRVADLSLHDIDYVIAFLGDPEGVVEKNLKKVFPKALIKIFPVFPYGDEKTHIALYMARSIREAGLSFDAENTIHNARKNALLKEEPLIKREGTIILHPGSGSLKKNYPPEFWLELIDKIEKQKPGQTGRMTLLLGPAEEGVLSFYNENLNKKSIGILFCPDKEMLISLLRKAHLYIGHDSGVTHLAAMLGTPVIALFKDSPVDQWMPLGPEVTVFENMESLDLFLFSRNI